MPAGGQVWLSGQIPADAHGNLIKGSTIEKAKAIIQNTEAILKEAGSGLDRVVKVVVSTLRMRKSLDNLVSSSLLSY
ncbi:hypothetical protein APSETT445_000447 [Aspergillus pseudonomiae]